MFIKRLNKFFFILFLFFQKQRLYKYVIWSWTPRGKAATQDLMSNTLPFLYSTDNPVNCNIGHLCDRLRNFV